MARLVIDLSEKELQRLDELGTLLQVPQDEVIRNAITALARTSGLIQNDSAFGLWANQSVEGAAFENQSRDEWR
ncbi:hypothetical protein [Ewingella americana]|jgi:hypothetical protein|uniref:hypothetical protein n=1 Tax=Ewingella americana TaxID=41202 RepID=UPI0012AD7D46|nr:hypothetical protein [Ewingella americana]MRT04622.1 hypothetical protein [Ewingella americana]